jgi:hypothetical protein
VWAVKTHIFDKQIGVNMKDIPAFPAMHYDLADNEHGLTMRDYFASSFVSSGHVFKLISDGNTPELVAKQAYLMADAMLKARGE